MTIDEMTKGYEKEVAYQKHMLKNLRLLVSTLHHSQWRWHCSDLLLPWQDLVVKHRWHCALSPGCTGDVDVRIFRLERAAECSRGC